MAEALMLEIHKPRAVPHGSIILSIFFQLCTIGIVVASVLMQKWFSYCYYDWGLYEASTSHDEVKDITDSKVYETIHRDLCGSYKPLICSLCKDFCGNIERFEDAGMVMMAFSLGVILLSLMYIVVFLFILSKKPIYSHMVKYGIWAAPMVQLAGIIAYLAVGNVHGVDKPYSSSQKTEVGVGLFLAYGAVGVALIAAVAGKALLGSQFEPDKQQSP